MMKKVQMNTPKPAAKKPKEDTKASDSKHISAKTELLC